MRGCLGRYCLKHVLTMARRPTFRMDLRDYSTPREWSRHVKRFHRQKKHKVEAISKRDLVRLDNIEAKMWMRLLVYVELVSAMGFGTGPCSMLKHTRLHD